MSKTHCSDQQPEFENYLPGMPNLGAAPGPVERLFTRLFRRRGRF